MAATPHLTTELLTQFANGRLSQTECESILTHLLKCDHCLGVMDKLWTKRPENAAAALPPYIAEQIEHTIWQRIHSRH